MTQPLIDISPDASKPEGGHAIVLVRAVAEMPDPLLFTISALPDDPDDPNSVKDWSLGEHKPIAARLTPDGLVMKIGPAIVDATELQPGTPVVFAVTSAGISAELGWPDLPVTIPGSLPAPLMDPSDLRAHKIEEAKHDSAQSQADKALDAAIAESIARDAPLSRAPTSAQPPQNVANLADISAAVAPAAAIGRTALIDALKTMPVAAKAPALQPVPLNLAVDQSATGGPQLAKAVDRAMTPGPSSMSAARDVVPAAQKIIATQERDGRASRNWLSIVLAIIAIPAILFSFWPSLSSRIGDQGTVNRSMAQLASSDWLTRVLAVGDVSPSGVDASNISASEALKRAEAAIFDADGTADLAERKFWLRKSISLLLAQPESRWAATQLGTLRTASPDPEHQPDYHSAKTLWEIASASGDTVAMCFLAQLYELGLGVIASKEKAKVWHERAARRGGCNAYHDRPLPALTN